MKVWVYRSRNGNHRVFTGDSAGFFRARLVQDLDNRCEVQDCIEMGLEVGGSEESGHFYIDDGGDIELFEVE